MIRARVAIVGAGPVGLSAALFLVSRGVSVVVLEAETDLQEDMRASTFHPPTLDMLEVDGIAEQLVRRGHRVRRWQYLRLDTRDAAIFDLGVLADRTRHPYRLQCEQFRLTRIILERLRDDPLFTISFGTTVVGFSENAAGVELEASRGNDLIQVNAEFLVGADGARSIVRRELGLDLEGETYPKTSITVVVDFPFERHLPEMLYVNYVWTADDHYSLMRVGDHWRTGFSPAAEQSLEEAISASNVQRHLKRILPLQKDYHVVHVGAYTVHRRLAAAFRKGRVLLAGDAAHLNSPSGGMGMNSGIHDAHALAAALDQSLRSQDEAPLERYAIVRREVARQDVQTQSDRNYRRHREKDSARREEIWRELKQITADPQRMRGFLLESSMLASVERARIHHESETL